MTVLSGLWGMNVMLPQFAGGPTAQFWWVVGYHGGHHRVMLAFFRMKHWI
jgi:Mg2+ and Co2+ transporter CorA